jgi:hypothetical protein
MYVPTIDGEMYYRKLTQIIEVEYYDKTKYVLFKCGWADNTRDRGYKVDMYGLMLVNFKNLVHKGVTEQVEQMYVLTIQVEQVFYIKNEMNPNWACAVRINPRNVYNVSKGQRSDNDEPNYHESKPSFPIGVY